ncbi:MAG: SIS domain-containing protein [Solirubrobacteraceae bacterium]
MSVTSQEIASQPDIWRRTAALLPAVADKLPKLGQRVAFLGCGTSWFVAQSAAWLREAAGQGESDAFSASELPAGRSYDLVVAISRSGTTTEVVRCLEALQGTPTVAICAVADTPVPAAAGEAIVLDFADEASVVQTRFATASLSLLRAHFGESIAEAAAEAERVIADSLPVDPSDFEQFVMLGHGWTVGLAAEAALKCREAGQAWAESYPAMEYRHGPVSVAGAKTLVWIFGERDESLVADIEATGACVLHHDVDPMAELVRAQRTAVALAESKGLDPDNPQHLTRSVVLG